MINIYDYYITPEEHAEAERNGIKPDTVDRRIRSLGWTKQKALTFPLRLQINRSHMKKVWKAHGISYKQFLARISVGWDETRAASVPLRDKQWFKEHIKRVGEKNRRYPRHIVDLALKYGIGDSTFRKRIRAGWSYELASTLPPSRSNSAMILKQKYGEDYFKKLLDWVFVNNRMKEKRS